MLLEIVLGVFFGLVFSISATWRAQSRENLIFAGGLVVAALLYVLFALAGGASGSWLLLEIAGVFPFALLAWLGVRGSPLWLALGWLLHVVWDTGLHLGAGAPGFVPPFFPTFCIGFDLVVGGWVAARTLAIRRARELTDAGDYP